MATPKRKKPQPARADRAQGGLSFFSAYLEASRAPLAILVFLAPLILVYELLLVHAVRSGQGLVTIDAHRWILTLFEALERFRDAKEDFALVLNEYALVVGLPLGSKCR